MESEKLERLVLTPSQNGVAEDPGRGDCGGDFDDPEQQLAARAKELPLDVRRLAVELRGFCGLAHAGGGFGRALAHLEGLRALELHFGDCPQLASVARLGEGLAPLQALETLTLDFSNCCAPAALDELGQELAHLGGLRGLVLDFHGCAELKSIDKLGAGLACLKKLGSLTLNFHCCTALARVDGLAKGFAQLAALQSLRLDLGGCDSLLSIGELGKSMAHLRSLNELSLVLAGCQGLPHIEKLADGLARLRGLRRGRLFLDLGSVVHLNPALVRSFHSVDDFLEVQHAVLAEVVAAQTTFEIIEGMQLQDFSTTIGSSHATPGDSASMVSVGGDTWPEEVSDGGLKGAFGSSG